MKKIISIFLLFVFIPLAASACSWVVDIFPTHHVFVATAFDWINTPFQQEGLYFSKKGTQRWSSTKNPIIWKSKYNVMSLHYRHTQKSKNGKIITSKHLVNDAFNDQGLAVHALSLMASQYPAPKNKKTLGLSIWTQYVADNYKTVSSLIKDLKNNKFPIMFHDVYVGNQDVINETYIHIAVEDRFHHSAVIEFIKGKVHIHSNVNVMTNDPIYEKQISDLHKYKTFGGNNSIPATYHAPDRFKRLSFFSQIQKRYFKAHPHISVTNQWRYIYNLIYPAITPELSWVNMGNHNSLLSSWYSHWYEVTDLTTGIMHFHNLHLMRKTIIDYKHFPYAKKGNCLVKMSDLVEGKISDKHLASLCKPFVIHS